MLGSFGWSGEAVKLVEDRLKGLKYALPVTGIFFRFKPTEEERESLPGIRGKSSQRQFCGQTNDLIFISYIKCENLQPRIHADWRR